jgi:hypothetical protein
LHQRRRFDWHHVGRRRQFKEGLGESGYAIVSGLWPLCETKTVRALQRKRWVAVSGTYKPPRPITHLGATYVGNYSENSIPAITTA